MRAREMDDYSALAQRIGVTVADVRGCLILSRDGLVLGSFPEDDEGRRSRPGSGSSRWVSPKELRRVRRPGLGVRQTGPVRGVRRGRAGHPTGRPGRSAGAGAPGGRGGPVASAEPVRACRTPHRRRPASRARSLHPPAASRSAEARWSRRSRPPTSSSEARAGRAGTGAGDPTRRAVVREQRRRCVGHRCRRSRRPRRLRSRRTRLSGDRGEAADARAAVGAHERAARSWSSAGTEGGGEDDAEVDRVLLAKEFSGLLQVDSDDDEASS